MGFFGKLLLKNGVVGGTAKVSAELYNLNALGKISHSENISMILDRRVALALDNKDNLINDNDFVSKYIKESCYDDLPSLVFLISLYETAQFRNSFSASYDVAQTTLEVIHEVVSSNAPSSIKFTKDEFIDKSIMYFKTYSPLIKNLERTKKLYSIAGL